VAKAVLITHNFSVVEVFGCMSKGLNKLRVLKAWLVFSNK